MCEATECAETDTESPETSCTDPGSRCCIPNEKKQRCVNRGGTCGYVCPSGEFADEKNQLCPAEMKCCFETNACSTIECNTTRGNRIIVEKDCICDCKDGFSGKDCSTDICSKCDPTGTNMALTESVGRGRHTCTCQCKDGYSGETCEKDICTGVACDALRGTHMRSGSTCTCVCKHGYSGDDCSVSSCDILDCESDGTDGTTFKEDGQCLCNCKPRHFGDRCQRDCSRCTLINRNFGPCQESCIQVKTPEVKAGCDKSCQKIASFVEERKCQGGQCVPPDCTCYSAWTEWKCEGSEEGMTAECGTKGLVKRRRLQRGRRCDSRCVVVQVPSDEESKVCQQPPCKGSPAECIQKCGTKNKGLKKWRLKRGKAKGKPCTKNENPKLCWRFIKPSFYSRIFTIQDNATSAK